MKTFYCKYCGSKDIFLKTDTHTGLYCADCGKWQKWLTKEEVKLAERQIEKKEGN